MHTHSVLSYIQRVDSRIEAMQEVLQENYDYRIQSVFANHIVLAGAGLVENAVGFILYEYCQRRSNYRIRTFVSKSVKRENTLYCWKIERLLNRFDKEWWNKVTNETTRDQRRSIDSMTDVRNQIAHGDYNGTGHVVALQYYENAKAFVNVIDKVVNS